MTRLTDTPCKLHMMGVGIVVVLVLLLQIFTVLEILSKVEALGLLFF